jgi:hypothetical protein
MKGLLSLVLVEYVIHVLVSNLMASTLRFLVYSESEPCKTLNSLCIY